MARPRSRHTRGEHSSTAQRSPAVLLPTSARSQPTTTPPRRAPAQTNPAAKIARSSPTTNGIRPSQAAPIHPYRPPSTSSIADPTPAPSPILRRPVPWQNEPEVSMILRGAPPHWTTWDVHSHLQRHGTIVYIELLESRRANHVEAEVKFKPAPFNSEWFHDGIRVDRGRYHITFVKKEFRLRTHPSPIDQKVSFPEETRLPLTELTFGVMSTPISMLKLHTASKADVNLNLQRKCLDVEFAVATSTKPNIKPSLYKMRLNLAQLKEVYMMKSRNTDNFALVIPVELPPQMFRKADNIRSTHAKGATSWSEWQTWFRQVEIDQNPSRAKTAITQLQKETPLIDIGRWLCYFMAVDCTIANSAEFKQFCAIVRHHNIPILEDKEIAFPTADITTLWKWLDNPGAILSQASSMSALHDLAEDITHLDFPIRYQLEVCISQGVLHECNIDTAFVEKLQKMDHTRAVKLLEKLADQKARYWNGEDIFKQLLAQVSVIKKSPPKYCAVIHSAIVTPTTIYFATPVMETSNRVVRQYQQYADRFLRVKFTDEKYKGKIMSHDNDSMAEVFHRIKRTLSNGIKVGDRHFEFLAAGNSQFREGGAWFFASIGDVTAKSIRGWMGDFDHIREVAKYCSRVGQCFSTTRALKIGQVEVQTIPDIERGDHNYTDGVGKISPFLAQMIADQHGLPNAVSSYPSVFQFRLGGSKGVLTVDPALTRKVVQIRPSQAKFSSINHADLNICRISQYSGANLNVQIILVLSALGVSDEVFIQKMDAELADLNKAMHDSTKAVELLCKNVDFNQMTLHLAQMVENGSMDARDPFTVSCLQLWHSWSVKYLKEKARVPVRKGAFVLGCVDETATLKGHLNSNEGIEDRDEARLPEIFLQISDPDRRGHWKIITGICTLARNPSLHPGDIRVVRAVDVPQLHHLRNCVVLPQTGDRDLASMCSGGDLDGDDYLIMWDSDLLPTEWNHPPMNYDPPPRLYSDGAVTVDDMTSFFVTHMKTDNLSRIAVAHKYWADFHTDGVKSPQCLELANLHSMAVDFAKTGVPARFPDNLKVKRWPHWAEVKNKSRKRIYQSKKVIGKLYDRVKRVEFKPAWHLPFDVRILTAYDLDDRILQSARETKEEYDAAIRRIMAKFSIASDFEVFTTFALEHSDDFSDYKFAETLGEVVGALKDHHKKLCYERAGTTEKERDWEKVGPFVAAMYTVTAQAVQVAREEHGKVVLKGGVWKGKGKMTVESMPFMSFPWLFVGELGRIANRGVVNQGEVEAVVRVQRKVVQRMPVIEVPELEPLEEVVLLDTTVTGLKIEPEVVVAGDGTKVDAPLESPPPATPQASTAPDTAPALRPTTPTSLEEASPPPPSPPSPPKTSQPAASPNPISSNPPTPTVTSTPTKRINPTASSTPSLPPATESHTPTTSAPSINTSAFTTNKITHTFTIITASTLDTTPPISPAIRRPETTDLVALKDEDPAASMKAEEGVVAVDEKWSKAEEEGEDADDDDGEVGMVTLPNNPSALAALEKMMGLSDRGREDPGREMRCR